MDAPKNDARLDEFVFRLVKMYVEDREFDKDYVREQFREYALPLRQAFQSQVEHANFVRSEYQKRLSKAESESAALRQQLQKLLNASECIRHWHDIGDDGMVVSAEHVRKLWQANADTRAALEEK